VRLRVVVVGPPGTGAASSSEALFHPGDDEAGLAERVAAEASGDAVLLLGEARSSGSLRRTSGLLAAVVEVPVVTRALPLGPLALRLLATCAAEEELPAYAVAAVDAAAADTWSAAWLPTVARLSDPAPTLRQHLRSWLPGGNGFLVEHAPRPRVRTATTATADTGAPDGAAERDVLVVCGIGAPASVPTSVLRTAQRLAGSPERLVVPGPGHLRSRYGTDDAVELAALPVARPVLPDPSQAPCCPSCGQPVPGEICPLCRVRTAPVPLESHP
jgi:hypothetical protein